MYRGHIWKIGLCNKKTKIYWTIKGLIILFIKLQFSIRCNQAFKPLRTSTCNIYLNIYLYLSLNPNGLQPYHLHYFRCICIISIHLMILNVHTIEVFIHLIKLSPGLRTCQAWRPLVYPFKGFCHSRYYPDVPKDEADIRTREKS